MLLAAALLHFSTFLGGRGLEFAGQVAFDPSGNIVVAGSTESTDFPGTTGPPKRVDAFIGKLTPDGSRILWMKFLGGTGSEDTLGLAVDANGLIYVCGRTDSRDFPITANAAQKNFAGGIYDGYVAKLSPEGEILYATYFGGNGGDAPDGIAVDGQGNFVIAGDTFSTDFPLLHSFQDANRGGSDLFITRFTADGQVVYSTLLGSSASDAGHGVAVDGQGNAWFIGAARKGDFPVVNALQPNYGGGVGDAVIVKVAPDGTILNSTYFGGSSGDFGDAIAVAPDGSVWILGRGDSPDMPQVNPIQGQGGMVDTFVARLSSDAKTVLFSTFLGGSRSDFPLDIVLTSDGQPIVCGETTSEDFPLRRAVQNVNGGGSGDAFVTMLKRDGSGIVFSTYLGGAGFDVCSSLARDRENFVVFSGSTASPNFPLFNPMQSTFRNGDDFVAKVDFTVDLRLTFTAPGSFTLENVGANDATDVVLTVGKQRFTMPSLAPGEKRDIVVKIPPSRTVTAAVEAAEPLRHRAEATVTVEVPDYERIRPSKRRPQ